MTKPWQAKWIRDPQFHCATPVNHAGKEYGKKTTFRHRKELQNHHMLVRKTMHVQKARIDKAWIDISADDYYKLYINGKFVSQGPAQSDHLHYYYNHLDIAEYLAPGENVIAVHVYYQGLVNRAYNSGDYRQGLIAEIHVNGELASQTDAGWKYRLAEEFEGGEPYGYQTQFPEHIDERRSAGKWREPGFEDQAWSFVEAVDAADYSFVLQPTPNLSVYMRKPDRIEKLGEGRFLIDFGQEITGQFTMRAQGIAGETMEIRCGEELADSGPGVKYALRCNCVYRDFWTLSGGPDALEFYDYKAFRYVEVIGREEAVVPDSFAAIVRHYPFDDESCQFRSDNQRLNQIFDICKNGVKYGSQEHFVDCPTREKGQYLGDNTIVGHSHMLLSGDLRLVKKAISQFALSSSVCPGLMAVVPGNLMQEIADFSLQWPMQLMTYYRQSGDWRFLQEMFPYAVGILRYFKKYDRGDGLLHKVKEKWNLVDWPEELRDDYDFPLTRPVGPGCHNVINALYYGCLKTVREIGEILGETTPEAEMERTRDSFVRVFFRQKTQLFADAEGSSHHSLHANILPLLFGLTPEGAVDAAVALIREKRLHCGVYTSYFLLKALAKAKEYDLIYDLMTSEDTRSWANMIKEGATTCFEAWGKDQKWNTSLCHPWASAPIPLLIEDIIGLRPAKPGWDEIGFEPHLPDAMPDFTFHMRVRTGRIQVVFKEGKLELFAPSQVRVTASNK